MKKISCTFYRPENVNVKEFENIVGKLESDFNTLCAEKSMNSDTVFFYVFDLLRQAKPLEDHPDMYYLGLDNPNNMPSDARVDFFYMPTYFGTSFIIKSILQYSELMEDWLELGWEHEDEYREELKTVFPGLLKGCTGRGFTGHGYDSLKGLIEALRIFAKAGTTEFIEKYPDLCPEFSQTYRGAVNHIEKLVKAGKAQGGWGEDYTGEAVELLRLTNITL